MLSLGLVLVAFAIGDLLTGGLAATPQADRWKRHLGVTFLLSLAAAGAYWLNVGNWLVCTAFFVVLWLGSSTWVLARVSSRRPWEIVALLVLTGAVMAAALIFPAVGEERAVVWLDAHLAKLPWSALEDFGSHAVILTVAALLFLGSTSNGIVRCCLQIVRRMPVAEAEATLKGGRFIGPLERILIFALVLPIAWS